MFKVFYADEYGEVHFSQEEFEAILNEVYEGGYNDGRRTLDIPIKWNSPIKTTKDYTITSPSYTHYVDYPSVTTTAHSNTECKCGGNK